MSLADLVQALKTLLLSVLLQFVQYVVLTINFRSIAHERYAAAGATAALAAILSAIIVRRVVKDDTWASVVGMAIGGGLADMAGIYLTRTWG